MNQPAPQDDPQPADSPAPRMQPQPQSQRMTVRVPNSRPVVVYTLLAVTILIYAGEYISNLMLGGDILFYYGGKINQFILMGQLWRFFTPALLHGSIAHLGFNMYFLYRVGANLERWYGHRRFLLLYVLGAFAGNAASFLFSTNPSLGSSTALFALIAAEGVFVLQNRQFISGGAMSALTNIVIVIVINLGIGLAPGTNIDNWGHLGGLVGGVVFAYFGGPKWGLDLSTIPPRIVDLRTARQAALGAVSVLALFGIPALQRILMQ